MPTLIGEELFMRTESLDLAASRGATTAHVALPEADTRAAIILIQEWWGINNHIRDIASRYAAEGFVCVAPDLYRGKLATTTEEASAMMHDLKIEDGMETIKAALAETKSKYNVNQVGITGYCMGGTFALRAACEISELAAAAPFYGDIPEDGVLKQLRVATLFIAGKRDAWINTKKVSELEAAARKYDLPLEVISYDADHAFFNDTRPEVFDAKAAKDAWAKVLAHFTKHLGEPAKQVSA
jgi:carboxymethylenebutenolidase